MTSFENILKVIELAFTTCVLILSVFFVVKRHFSKRRSSIEFNIDYDRRIAEILKQILDTTHASSVRVYEYHNGVTTASGRSFTKMSVVSEMVKQGMKPLMRRLQEIPTMLMNEEQFMLIHQKLIVIPDVELVTDVPTRMFFKEKGVQSVMICAVNNSVHKQLQGLITVAFDDAKQTEELTQYASLVMQRAEEIAFLLEREESFIQIIVKGVKNAVLKK